MPFIPAGVRTVPHCRICGPTTVEPQTVLDLGSLDLVCFPKTAHAVPHPPVPVVVQQCRYCSLVQLRYTAPRDWLYDEYWYRSGTNDTMVEELTDIVEAARKRTSAITDRSLVVDIGANDGTLLAAWRGTAKGVGDAPYRIAFEPSGSFSATLAQHAEEIQPVYFPHPHQDWMHAHRGCVQVVTSIAMIYDLDNPHVAIEDIRQLLTPDGLWIAEFQDLLTVVDTTGVDYFCHEHLCCYSLTSFKVLVEGHGLQVVDVERRPINGGSLRVYVKRTGVVVPPKAIQRVQAQLAAEVHAGLGASVSEVAVRHPWGTFLERVHTMVGQVQGVVQQVQDRGETLDLYGASTKGTVLLQLCGLTGQTVRCAWERASAKWGRYVAGTGVPIVSEATGRAQPPEVLLVPIWQFRAAVIQREAEYLAKGGALVFPLPAPSEVYRVGGGAR